MAARNPSIRRTVGGAKDGSLPRGDAVNTPSWPDFCLFPVKIHWMVQGNVDAPRRAVHDLYGDAIEILDPPFYRKEFEDAYRFIVDDYAVVPKAIGLFLPCAVRKPYSQSPSHKLFRRIIGTVLDPEDYHIAIFGTCGAVPAELECMYPYRLPLHAR